MFVVAPQYTAWRIRSTRIALDFNRFDANRRGLIDHRLIHVVARALAPRAAALDVVQRLPGAVGEVDLAMKLRDVSLCLGGRVGAVELRDLAEQGEAFGVVADDPVGGHEQDAGG